MTHTNTASNREKINQILHQIVKDIGQKKSDNLIAELEALKKYKPLNSLYYYVYGSVLYHEGRYDEALEIVSNKENWWHPSQYTVNILEVMINCFIKLDDPFKAEMYSYLKIAIEGKTSESGALANEDLELKTLQELVLNEKIASAEFTRLLELYTARWRFLEAMLIYQYMEKNGIESHFSYDMYSFADAFRTFEPNLGYFREQLMSGKGNKFIIFVEDIFSETDYQVMIKMLKAFDCSIIVIDEAIACDLEYEINIEDTVEISMENSEEYSNYKLIRPIEVYVNGIYAGNNVAELTGALACGPDSNYYNVLSTRNVFDGLAQTQMLKQNIQCLSPTRQNLSLKTMAFGYVGDYFQYLDRLYGTSYLEAINQKDEVEFSIVIPARNAAGTLQATIQTCLEQRNIDNEKYEIIISDNSTDGNLEIFHLIEEINDPRIKYFKTPRNLPLNRSFEFAFSKARGNFIIPLGADDAILPWGLEYLRKIIKEYPEDRVITWHRAFFQWTESLNNPNAGKVIIPGLYKKDEMPVSRHNSFDAIIGVLVNPEKYMYYLPTLYINSGFKRSYLMDVYRETGRLWDGYTQDMYMTLVNLIINETIIVAEVPLTIAGMSDSSLGAKSIRSVKDNKDYIQLSKEFGSVNGFGSPVVNSYQVESCGIDISLIIAEFFRILEGSDRNGPLAKLAATMDWRIPFKKTFDKLNPMNIDYFIKLNILRDDAYKISEELGTWFERECFSLGEEQLYVEDVTAASCETTTFEKGFINESLHLDARDFNVYDVNEAAKLIERILNL